MNRFVIDANVPIVANGNSVQANPDCVKACIEILEEIYTKGRVCLDESMLILYEYMANLSMNGEPGAGDAFMQWIWEVQANPKHCKQVRITPDPKNPQNFTEFPRDTRLKKFDISDRKYVAVAIASGCSPEILDAVDPDWAEHFTALHAAGVRIRFICPQHVCSGAK